jgi:hypothetical protein
LNTRFNDNAKKICIDKNRHTLEVHSKIILPLKAVLAAVLIGGSLSFFQTSFAEDPTTLNNEENGVLEMEDSTRDFYVGDEDDNRGTTGVSTDGEDVDSEADVSGNDDAIEQNDSGGTIVTEQEGTYHV